MTKRFWDSTDRYKLGAREWSSPACEDPADVGQQAMQLSLLV